MKTKQLNEIKSKKESEIFKHVKEKKLELLKSQAMIGSGQEKNLKKAKNLRVEIAQLMTILNEKKLSEKVGDSEDK